MIGKYAQGGGFGGNRAYMTAEVAFSMAFIRSADERADFAEVRAPPGDFSGRNDRIRKREIGL
ncbi:MAG: hypothetical protein ACLS4Z_04135 [Christensenellaceae bacterium]